VRWLPHINLIYPFVHDEFFVEAAPALTKALADFKVRRLPLLAHHLQWRSRDGWN
jgi:hypothetical protein